MIAYSYDDNGYFVSEVDCPIDPLETKIQKREIFIIPGNATTIKPLDPKEGFKVKFVSNKWIYEAIPQPEPEPEPTPQQKIQERVWKLKSELYSSDYKIIKCVEAQLIGAEAPYDVARLLEERQALRDEINSYENQLEAE